MNLNPSLQLTMKVAREFFFDRQTVRQAADTATRKVLSRFGAFVRQRAKTSIRKRKTISEPGNPPHSHIGTLRKHIYFIYEPTIKTVIIGPALTQSKSEALRLLEYGGIANRGNKTYVYRPRPFMRPAFAEELKRLPVMWRNMIRR